MFFSLFAFFFFVVVSRGCLIARSEISRGVCVSETGEYRSQCCISLNRFSSPARFDAPDRRAHFTFATRNDESITK